VTGSVKACVFCGETGRKITRGHIYGEQLLDELPPPPPGVPFLSKIMLLDPQQNEWGTVEERDPRSPRYMPVNVICEPCNGAWMGTCEAAVREILVNAQHAPAVRFTRYPQNVLALWISIVSILSQYVHKSTIITPAADRRYVLDHNEPAPGTHIWLARSGEGPSSIVAMVHALDELVAEEDSVWTRHRYVFGLVFGPFAALLIGGITDDVPLDLKTKPAGAFYRIWPREGSFGWAPTTPTANGADLDIFRQRVADYLTPRTPPLTTALDILQHQ
jgi:hypothetical protein